MDRRADNIMMAGIISLIEAEAMVADITEVEGVMERATARPVIGAKDQVMLPVPAGRKPQYMESNYPPTSLAARIQSIKFLMQTHILTTLVLNFHLSIMIGHSGNKMNITLIPNNLTKMVACRLYTLSLQIYKVTQS